MSAGARQKRNGSSWGLVGIVASAAAVWLFGAWQIGQNKAKKARSDASYLTQMLALPLRYTEHAQCRMDCRWELSLLSHSLSCAHVARSVLISHAPRQHAFHVSASRKLPCMRWALQGPGYGFECACCCLRHVSDREVRSTLKKGSINARKSDLAAFPCPKVVVDAAVGRMPKNVQASFPICQLHGLQHTHCMQLSMHGLHNNNLSCSLKV